MLKRVFLSADRRYRNGWKALFFLVTMLVALRAVGKAAHLVHLPKNELLQESILAGVMFLISWIFVRAEGVPFRSLGWKLDGRWGGDLLIGTLIGIGTIVLSALGAMSSGAVSLVRSGQGVTPMLSGALLFLVVALFEEGVFRGYLFQRLTRGAGFFISQIVMALFFALAHWGNPGMHGATLARATVDIGLAGVLLGFCWQRTQSLALPIGVHLGWNWAQGSLLGFGVSGTDPAGFFKPIFAAGKPEWLSGGAFGLEASLPDILVCILAILAIWVWKGRPAAAETD
jgi:membrane protease YdiL (CAAX protease family)